MSTALLILGLLAAASTVTALVRVRHPGMISPLVMMTGWLVGELPLLHLLLQALVTGVLVGSGALDEPSGWVGLIAMVLSWAGLVRVRTVANRARGVLADALAAAGHAEAASEVRERRPDPGTLWRPFHFDKRGIDVVRDIPFGDLEGQRLDVYRPAGLSEGEARGVMFYIHGGGWVMGYRERQGLPMLHQMTRRGWVCVSVDYRLAPRNRWPAQFEDVARGLEWTVDNIAEFGGPPSGIVVSGGSAGGHLAALTALDERTGPLVSGCVPIYGAFDFTDHLNIRGYAAMRPFLERMVMTTKLGEDREGWMAASPIHLIHEDVPPFFVVHGALDVFLYAEETRAFVERLAAVSSQPIAYAEVPGAQHAFEIFHSVRAAATVDAIEAFSTAVVGGVPRE